MRRKQIFLIAFSCIIANISYAQVTVIPSLGMSRSFSEYTEFSQPGFNAGVLFDFPFPKKSWSFQTGICSNNLKMNEWGNYTRIIGGKSITFDDGRTSRYNFLEIPANLVKRVGLSEDANLYFTGGAYLGIFLSGEDLLRSSNGISDYALFHAYDADYVHLGFMIGTGVEIHKVLIGFDLNLNATDYYPLGFNWKLKVGYRF